MAEDAGSPEPGDGADPVAIGAAISRSSPAVDAELVAYLHAQRHHLNAQRLATVWEKWLGVFLRAATACVGVAVAGGLSLLIWQAAHSDGLRVKSFSVPPAFAERGLTGEVVAARVIDRLSELQTQTNTGRPARSYTNAWGDKAIKLEIPETGISLEELDSWLRARLGQETPLTGEMVRNDTGVTLTARTADGAVSISGAEADMDALTGRLAEAIYRLTQPYRYAIYLMRHENRPADAAPIFKNLALNGTPDDKRWSYNMWAQAVENSGPDHDAGLRMYRRALAADPTATGVYVNLVGDLSRFGRIEEALQTQRQFQIRANAGLSLTPSTPAVKRRNQALIDDYLGAYRDSLPAHEADVRTGVPGFAPEILLNYLLPGQIGLHELTAARTSAAELSPGLIASRYAMLVALEAQEYRQVLGHGGDMAAYIGANPHDGHIALVYFAPPLALAQAHLENFATAERIIAPTPADCYPCLIARAQVAEMGGQRGRAEYWFTRADAAGPSLPFAFEAEGRALLGRGQPDRAIERFTIAGRKSPHFADPLEGWGEALMAKNQSHLALAKFAEGEKYAPNWGRLHLKWGEALAYAGKRDDAQKQFARAAALDLTPSERSELADHSQSPH